MGPHVDRQHHAGADARRKWSAGRSGSDQRSKNDDPGKLNSPAQVNARAACLAAGVTDQRFLPGCIFDVSLTGDPAFARRTSALATQIAQLEAGTAAPTSVPSGVTLGTPVNFVVNANPWRLAVVAPPLDVTDRQAGGIIGGSSLTEGTRLYAISVAVTNLGNAAAPLPWKPFETPFFTVGNDSTRILADARDSQLADIDDCLAKGRTDAAPGATTNCSFLVSLPNGSPTLTIVADDFRSLRFSLR